MTQSRYCIQRDSETIILYMNLDSIAVYLSTFAERGAWLDLQYYGFIFWPCIHNVLHQPPYIECLGPRREYVTHKTVHRNASISFRLSLQIFTFSLRFEMRDRVRKVILDHIASDYTLLIMWLRKVYPCMWELGSMWTPTPHRSSCCYFQLALAVSRLLWVLHRLFQTEYDCIFAS